MSLPKTCYTKITLFQGVKYVRIFKNKITAKTNFYVLLSPAENKIDIYGSCGEYIRIKDKKIEKIIKGSKISISPSRQILQDGISSRKFLGKGKSFLLGPNCRIFLRELCLHDRSELFSIDRQALNDTSRMVQVNMDNSSAVRNWPNTKNLEVTGRRHSEFSTWCGRGRFGSITKICNLRLDLLSGASFTGSMVLDKVTINNMHNTCTLRFFMSSACMLEKCERVIQGIESINRMYKWATIRRRSLDVSIASMENDFTEYVRERLIKLQQQKNGEDFEERAVDRHISSYMSEEWNRATIVEIDDEPSQAQQEVIVIDDEKPNKFEITGKLNYKDIEVPEGHSDLECSICRMNLSVTVVDCGHVAMCLYCAGIYAKSDNKCTICRYKITTAIIPHNVYSNSNYILCKMHKEKEKEKEKG